MISYKTNQSNKSHTNGFHGLHRPTLRGFSKGFYRKGKSTFLERIYCSGFSASVDDYAEDGRLGAV